MFHFVIEIYSNSYFFNLSIAMIKISIYFSIKHVYNEINL